MPERAEASPGTGPKMALRIPKYGPDALIMIEHWISYNSGIAEFLLSNDPTKLKVNCHLLTSSDSHKQTMNNEILLYWQGTAGIARRSKVPK